MYRRQKQRNWPTSGNAHFMKHRRSRGLMLIIVSLQSWKRWSLLLVKEKRSARFSKVSITADRDVSGDLALDVDYWSIAVSCLCYCVSYTWFDDWCTKIVEITIVDCICRNNCVSRITFICKWRVTINYADGNDVMMRICQRSTHLLLWRSSIRQYTISDWSPGCMQLNLLSKVY